MGSNGTEAHEPMPNPYPLKTRHYLMGSNGTEAHEPMPNPYPFKVHCLLCIKLMKLVDRVSAVLPKIEEARPQGQTGFQSLCSLNLAIEKAKMLLQYCRESSKLYLAATGDAIVRKFRRSSDSLEQSLRDIKDMLPVLLELEVTQIANDLRNTTYILDSSEEEAGKAVNQLLRKIDSTLNSEEEAFRTAALKLNITSQKEINIEKMSIKKLHGNMDPMDRKRKSILMCLYNLLLKYGDLVLGEDAESVSAVIVNSVSVENSFNGALNCQSVEDKPHRAGSETKLLTRAAAPEEYKCPLSLRIMYDPVTIASGQTYERFWIQKWLDEGHDTCPKTGMKLSNRSMIPNVSLKDLISKWCIKSEVAISDPSTQPETHSWEYSSVSSFGSSMDSFHLHTDFSNTSLQALDALYNAYSLPTRPASGLSLTSMQTKDDCSVAPSDGNPHEKDLEFPANLGDLEWEMQCKAISDLKNNLKENDEVCPRLSETAIEHLVRFLRDAHDQRDSRAEEDGAELFLAFVSKSREGVLNIREETLSFLSSLLHSAGTNEVLSMLGVLSRQQQYISKFAAPGVLASILELIDSPISDLKKKALDILSCLSSSYDICSHIVSTGCVPKLVPLFNDGDLSENCILLLQNLCNFEEARISVVETEGCLAFVSQLLESGSRKKQEHAVMALLSLCSQRVQYCELLMEYDIITSLANISVNGSKKGQAGALELLRLFEDVRDDQESQKFEHDASTYCSYQHVADENKASSKPSGFFGRKIAFFSKHSSQEKKK